MLSYFTIIIGLITLTKGEIDCQIKTNVGGASLSLSNEALNGIVFKSGQSSSGMQVLECTCGTDQVIKS